MSPLLLLSLFRVSWPSPAWRAMPDTAVENDIELANLAPAEPEAFAEVVKPVIDDSQASPPPITRKAFLSLLAQHTSR